MTKEIVEFYSANDTAIFVLIFGQKSIGIRNNAMAFDFDIHINNIVMK